MLVLSFVDDPGEKGMDVCRCLSDDRVRVVKGPLLHVCGLRRFGQPTIQYEDGGVPGAVGSRVGREVGQLGDCRVSVCAEQGEGEAGLDCAGFVRLEPVVEASCEPGAVFIAKCLEGAAPLRRFVRADPLDQVGQRVRAHVKQGNGFGVFVLARDPFAEFAALVGRLGVVGEDGEGGARDERGQEQGELLPMSPHGGSVA